jgi:hypothetical protein
VEDVRKIVEKERLNPEPVIGSGKFFCQEKKESRLEKKLSETSAAGIGGGDEKRPIGTDWLADGRGAEPVRKRTR